MKRHFAASLMCLVWTVAAAHADIVETRDHRQLEGEVTLVGDSISLKTADGPIKLSLGDVVSLRRESAPAPFAPPATGLLAEYFSDPAFGEPCSASLVEGGDFSWGERGPQRDLPRRAAGRLSGVITIPRKGVYRFRIENILRATIGSLELGSNARAGELLLETGQRVPVSLEVRHGDRHFEASLWWSSPELAPRPIPSHYFSPPDDLETRLAKFYEAALPNSRAGVKVEYFHDLEMAHLAFARFEPSIVRHWDNVSALDARLKKRFAARWTGTLKSGRSGRVRFATTHDAHLWVGDKLVIGEPGPEGRAARSGSIELSAGQTYNLRMQVLVTRDDGGEATLLSDMDGGTLVRLPPSYLFPPGDVPRAQVITPLPGAEIDATDGMRVRVVAIPGVGQISKVEIINSKGKEVLAETNRAPFDLTIRPNVSGKMEIAARVTNSNGVSAVSPSVKITLNSAPGKNPGGRWSAGRVGDTTPPDVSGALPRIVMTARGGEFGEFTKLPLVSRILSGDGELVARLVELSSPRNTTMAVAGLTIRRSMEPESAHLTLVANHSVDKKTGWILSNPFRGEDAGIFMEKPLVVPVWIRVRRAGVTATASFSADGQHWTDAGSAKLGDDRPVVAGLCALALNSDGPVTAVFDHVMLTQADAASLASGPGVQLTNGTVVCGKLSFGPQVIRVEDRHQQTHVFATDRVARIFYAPVSSFSVADLPSGWRGAFIHADRMEGSVSDLSTGGATVTSILFGSQELTPRNGLIMVSLADVKPNANAVVVRHSEGQLLASAVEIRGGKVVVQDPVLGMLTLSIEDVRSIEQPRAGMGG